MSLQLFSLHGKTALVTGGNGGLGRALALGLREAGAAIALTGRDPAKNAAVKEEFGADALVLPLDVREEPAVERAVAAVVERFGRLDILVNNAGLLRMDNATELSRADWDAVLETHLTGAFLCAKHAARAMRAGGRGGKIINIGSIYSLFGFQRASAYAAAKAGLLGLTRSLAIELAPHNIQVNAILPGWYETDLTRGMPATPLGETIRRKTPAGRWGEPHELVGAAVFLASAASSFVTGAALPVDGGYAIMESLADA
jgi:2-deoxy-D-gluconate 3-dehydrogenase